MVATAYRGGGQGAGDREKRGREVYGKRDYQGGGKQETKGTITQHCAIFRNRKNAVKRRGPTNTGPEPGRVREAGDLDPLHPLPMYPQKQKQDNVNRQRLNSMRSLMKMVM